MKWIVCFHKKRQHQIFYKLFTFVAPKYTHCHVMRYDVDSETWSWLEYHSSGFRHRCTSSEDADHLIDFVMKNCCCIEIDADKAVSFVPQFMWPWIYCVTFCKHVIGFNKWWVLTPHRLYCELLKHGGREIFVSSEGVVDGQS